mmetsp:Transcript_35662/g.82870  ORF Transcript_35662/g.82870 Transcript_35662/m.82870 type:complete len:244 (-) Transcript_35662:133-864(-)
MSAPQCVKRNALVPKASLSTWWKTLPEWRKPYLLVSQSSSTFTFSRCEVRATTSENRRMVLGSCANCCPMQLMACVVKLSEAARQRPTCSEVRAPSCMLRSVTIPYCLRSLAFAAGRSFKGPRTPLNGSLLRDQPLGVHICSKVRTQSMPLVVMERLSPSRMLARAVSTCPTGTPSSVAPTQLAPTTCSTWPWLPEGPARESTTASCCAATRPRACACDVIARRTKRSAAEAANVANAQPRAV